MAVEVKQLSDDEIEITVDGASVSMDAEAARRLAEQLAQLLNSGSAVDESDRTIGFLRGLGTANDVGIQNLLRAAADDDVLVLLKLTENQPAVTRKLYDNMTERSAKIYAEDLQFKFQDALPETVAAEALDRLSKIASELAGDGTLTFGPENMNPM